MRSPVLEPASAPPAITWRANPDPQHRRRVARRRLGSPRDQLARLGSESLFHVAKPTSPANPRPSIGNVPGSGTPVPVPPPPVLPPRRSPTCTLEVVRVTRVSPGLGGSETVRNWPAPSKTWQPLPRQLKISCCSPDGTQRPVAPIVQVGTPLVIANELPTPLPAAAKVF